jgi:UTP--glucose-1-phosphate uridylyltransferase
MLLRKIVIPCAGLGTRLFPATKEQPKEMLPVFSKSLSANAVVKPLLQMVFEQLYNIGFREFCFIVGRGKRSIEDHFTPDHNSVGMLQTAGKDGQAIELNGFYEKLNTSTLLWVNQPEPKGFGNAVLMAQPYVQNEHCLVHAGDTCIVSEDANHINNLIDIFKRFRADAAFLVQEIDNPKQYGVIEAEELEEGIYRVREAVEKPEKPLSNLAIMPIYVFHPVIFKALEEISPDRKGEVQLTDAIQKLVESNLKVYAVRLNRNHVKLDIGSPETYWEALSLSHQLFCGRTQTDRHNNQRRH